MQGLERVVALRVRVSQLGLGLVSEAASVHLKHFIFQTRLGLLHKGDA